MGLDGIVIATPSALHSAQSIAALRSGCAVFCQKPLGRNADETRAVLDAARDADRLLGVDLSYRFTRSARIVRERIGAGDLGEIYAAELVFHNAYGPDKAWFYDPALAGGGCVLDLGIHLVDLLLWTLEFPEIEAADGRLFRGGRPLLDPSGYAEDYAVARIDLASGASATLACSWNLPAGRDAVIRATFYGTRGGICIENVDGSFYDFRTLLYRRTATELLDEGPDDWGGRAAVEWAQRLGEGRGFDPDAEHLVRTAEAIDAIYGRDAGFGWKRRQGDTDGLSVPYHHES